VPPVEIPYAVAPPDVTLAWLAPESPVSHYREPQAVRHCELPVQHGFPASRCSPDDCRLQHDRYQNDQQAECEQEPSTALSLQTWPDVHGWR
jgi:hypothetical protein